MDLDLEEDAIFLKIRVRFDNRLLREHGAARSDVHLADRSPEARARRVSAERVRDVMLAALLVEQRQRRTPSARPRQQCVILAAHDDEEQRQVRATAHTVDI